VPVGGPPAAATAAARAAVVPPTAAACTLEPVASDTYPACAGIAPPEPDRLETDAGLRPGDVIDGLGRIPVDGLDARRVLAHSRRPGNIVDGTDLREGDVHVAPATLGARP